MKHDEVLNPQTGRFIKIGAQRHKRLVRLGVLPPVPHEEPPQNQKQTAQADPRPDPLGVLGVPPPPRLVRQTAVEPTPLPVKKYLLEEATDIIKDHQRQFEPDLTQEQTDRLLKKLLYEKLCVRRKTKKERHTKKRKKHDKRKTKNIRVRQIVSSSSSSDSDSGSDDSYSE
jgi:hypothetical protein